MIHLFQREPAAHGNRWKICPKEFSLVPGGVAGR